MKDNLNIGFFLMDRTYTIQEHYSRALEQLFSTGSLGGKNFIGLLAASLRDSDAATLKDYFDMVFNEAFDQDLLDEINPISELPYTGVETGEEKTLGCGFKAVRRGAKEVFILGNIRDITAEKTLQTRLAEEEAKRQDEMRFLFEVVQGDLRVLRDFIEDMDYEFGHIDAASEDRRLGSRELLVNWYQSVHAIKSNAVILGLKTFGEKFHLLESEIKGVLEQEAVLEEDIEGISGGVRGLKQEKGKLISVIRKIQSFKAGKKGNQGEYVLIESLTRACNKVASDMGKQVQLVVKHIDPESIERGPRRVIKEVLVQLIRNAVYHGIEGREERGALGKDETGIITLSIGMEGGKIRVRMGDDGKGVDFGKVRAKAEALGLAGAGGGEGLLEAIFLPGFSTAEEEGVHAGRGMGLNLVRDRIEELGGTIGVESEPGKGTVFTIIIPPANQAAENQASYA
jgi:two-component system chemotaxis sensor kinase CheA